jgi:predicted Mrr-cat superfamily restriction endonuclease
LTFCSNCGKRIELTKKKTRKKLYTDVGGMKRAVKHLSDRERITSQDTCDLCCAYFWNKNAGKVFEKT